MDNYEYERTQVLAELRQYVQKCEAEAAKLPPQQAEIVLKDIRWHKELLAKYK